MSRWCHKRVYREEPQGVRGSLRANLVFRVFIEKKHFSLLVWPLVANPGRGAVWLARLTGGQEVAGSSPVAPIGWSEIAGFAFSPRVSAKLTALRNAFVTCRWSAVPLNQAVLWV